MLLTEGLDWFSASCVIFEIFSFFLSGVTF